MRRPREATNIAHAMEFLLSVTKRKSICFVVSDFLDTGFERALVTANQRHDVIAVLVTDPRELELPAVGLVTLRRAFQETGMARSYLSNLWSIQEDQTSGCTHAPDGQMPLSKQRTESLVRKVFLL